MKKLKVGLAGYGKSARVFHVPFITTMEEFELTTVLERHANDSQKEYPFVRVVRTIDELVADPSLDLIVITTPNNTHFEYASKALLAGKNVVLEKPFTNTVEEAQELVELAKKSKGLLSVYQNRRYVSDFLTIKDLLDENALGDVHEFIAMYDRYRAEPVQGSWREADLKGSGVLYDLGPHIIDQALVLFGKPKNITADIKLQRPFSKVDDYFNIWLDFGFLKVTLHASMLIRQPGPRYMIHGTKGSFIKNGEDPQEALLKAGVLPLGEDWGAEPEESYGFLNTEINGKHIERIVPSRKGNYGLYYLNIYNSIVNGAPLHERPEHGYNTIKLIDLAFESNNLKRTLHCEGLL